jgi:hypothetical protein
MIYAELHGKAAETENGFTSNVLGLLSFLPASDMLQFLRLAHTREEKFIKIPTGPETDIEVEFWPYLNQPRVCIPDAIVTSANSTGDILKLILEVKAGAPQTGEFQLSDYWKARSMHYPGQFELIYLTHYRSTPKDELRNSEQSAGPNSQIYWLNWHSLFLLVQRWLSSGISRPFSEKRILVALKCYLIERGYQTFVPWQPLASGFRVSYTRKYLWSAGEPVPRLSQYMHRFFCQIIPKAPPFPYSLKRMENVP